MKSFISSILILLVVLIQVGSTGFNVSKKTCEHSKEVTYSIGNSKCTCKKHTKTVKSCCSSKKEVKKRCCELESIAGAFDFKNTTPSYIQFASPFDVGEEVLFIDTQDIVDIEMEVESIYDPPPNLIHGTKRYILHQSFLI